LAEPKQGLFGRLRGEARVRARVRPAPVRPKQERRRGRAKTAADSGDATVTTAPTAAPAASAGNDAAAARSGSRRAPAARRSNGARRGRSTPEPVDAASPAPLDPSPATDPSTIAIADRAGPAASTEGHAMTDDRPIETTDLESVETVDVTAVEAAAVDFMGGLASAFGYESSVESSIDGTEIEVRVNGSSLGLLIGPSGRTLLAIQDLARVAAQRRLGDHDTRLRVDVSGYREKRRAALERFADTVAEQVRTSGVARSLDPMPSADRKVLHDALADIDGVTSRSEGEDPYRRVVVLPG
ncbi:MAG: R3H domain-containing nucleic acid-binding protein, partial [Ilumatobacteraceae bacterium]